MGWNRSRRDRKAMPRTNVERRLATSHQVAPPTVHPGSTRPTLVPPGETRYRKTAGLRTRLAVAAEAGDDIHITIDLTELRSRTVR